jgi:hypothetical protein
MVPAFAPGFRRTFTILREIARIVWRSAAAVATLTALASGFHRTRAIIGKIARTLLSADMPRARRFLAIEREIAAIGDGSRF